MLLFLPYFFFFFFFFFFFLAGFLGLGDVDVPHTRSAAA